MREPDGKLTRECEGLDGSHEYAERTCPKCGATYCYSCCLSENVSCGGKYTADYMLCPACGADYYKED